MNLLESLIAIDKPSWTMPAQRRPLAGENCTVILTDVVGFGSSERTDRDRRVIRAAHQEMMQAALGDLWKKEKPQDQGDGLLIVVPPASSTTAVMERLHRTLPAGLRRHNDTHDEPARFQLRIAVHVGPVTTDDLGWLGEVLIRAARLGKAPALKEAMAATGADLGFIISAYIYEMVITHAEEWAGRESYSEVEVHVKESHDSAWMQLFGQPLPSAA